jgi:hypothetical protein
MKRKASRSMATRAGVLTVTVEKAKAEAMIAAVWTAVARHRLPSPHLRVFVSRNEYTIEICLNAPEHLLLIEAELGRGTR